MRVAFCFFASPKVPKTRLSSPPPRSPLFCLKIFPLSPECFRPPPPYSRKLTLILPFPPSSPYLHPASFYVETLTGTPSPPPSPPHTSCPDPKTLPSTTRLGGAEARRRKNIVPPVLTVLPTTGAHLLSLLLRLRPRQKEVPLPGSPS